MTVFGATVTAVDVEIGALLKLMLDDAEICQCHGKPLLTSALDTRPFVDVNPSRIPRHDARSRDRVEQILTRQPTTLLPSAQTRIACPTPAVAKQTAALLRGLGAPARAIHLGGF